MLCGGGGVTPKSLSVNDLAKLDEWKIENGKWKIVFNNLFARILKPCHCGEKSSLVIARSIEPQAIRSIINYIHSIKNNNIVAALLEGEVPEGQRGVKW